MNTKIYAFTEKLSEKQKHFLGFPSTLNIDLTSISPLLTTTINNIGDPYDDSLSSIHSHEFEREVIEFFAQLLRINAEDAWGYVTNGSSESNMFALNLARELQPKAHVFYSESAHYSIPKYTHMLRIPSNVVTVDDQHEMDYDDLKTKLTKHAQSVSKSAIIVATIGSTMAEARDNIHTIRNVARESGITSIYIHSDAALAGLHSALLSPRHPFDFTDGADSVCISGHKFLGVPTPCGVILTKKQHRLALQALPNYTGATDTTITGSRNGHTPLMLWHIIEQYGMKELKSYVEAAQNLAEYAFQELRSIGWESWRNPQALTIMIKSPPKPIIEKWQLATTNGWSHIICMPSVTKEKIDSFIADIAYFS